MSVKRKGKGCRSLKGGNFMTEKERGEHEGAEEGKDSWEGQERV